MTESTELFGAPQGVCRTAYQNPCRKKFTPEGTVRYPSAGPSGLRRLSPASLAALSGAEQFAGLPEGVAKPAQLLAALKAAAPYLKLPARLIFALDWMFRFTRTQDWVPGSRPVVWPSARMQAEDLMLSPGRVKALNRALIEAGLIAPADSPNGKRYGRRDAEGRIIEAYGFDLSPLAARYAEFCRLAREGRDRRDVLARQRRRITITRRALAQLEAVMTDYALDDAALARHAAEVRHTLLALAGMDVPSEREDALRAADRALQALQTGLEAALAALKAPDMAKNAMVTPVSAPVDNILSEDAEGTPDIVDKPVPNVKLSQQDAPMGLVSGPRYNKYKPSEYPEKDTVSGSEQGRSESPRPANLEIPVFMERGKVKDSMRLRPVEVAELAPQLKPYLSGDPDDPDWPTVIRAADWLGRDLGISRPLWAEACDLLSDTGAAIALAVVASKDPDYFTRTPGHYFRGMVRKAVSGDLHLDRSIWGLREASGLRRNGEGRSRSDRATAERC